MKPTGSDSARYAGERVAKAKPGIGRQVLLAGLWLASVGFWLWAGVQLGRLIGQLWF